MPDPNGTGRTRGRVGYGLAALGLAIVVVAVIALGGSRDSRGAHVATLSQPPSASDVAAAQNLAAGDPLTAEIARTQSALQSEPRDWQSWATLGLDYVQQAKITVNPMYYPKAAGALRRSLALDRRNNFIAMAGEASLSSARHHFGAALSWARRGLAIDPHSGVLYGALNDAQTQLGHYRAAATAARTMESIDPGTDADARLSYVEELHGHVGAARAAMKQALADAGSVADQAFAHYYLGELANNHGQPRRAIAQDDAGLLADPTSSPLLEGRAKAEWALGHTALAIKDFATVVGRVPQPSYVLEYGELLQSLGRTADAQEQYTLFRTEEKLFASNGVALDTDETLFDADHASPAAALAAGRQGIAVRPFLEMDDAYAWALHVAGHDRRALSFARRAAHTGMKNALFRFHLGVIEGSLGHRNEARADVRRALQINPHFSPLLVPQAHHLLQHG